MALILLTSPLLFDSSSYYFRSNYLSISVSNTVFITVFDVSRIYCSTSNICRWLGVLGNSPLAKAFMRQVLPIPFLPTKPYFLPQVSLRFVVSSKVFPAMINDIFYKTRSQFLPAVPNLYLLICTGGNYFFFCSIYFICFCKLRIAFYYYLSFPFYFFFHLDI